MKLLKGIYMNSEIFLNVLMCMYIVHHFKYWYGMIRDYKVIQIQKKHVELKVHIVLFLL